MSAQLKLLAEARRRRQTEKERVDEVTRLINENLVHGKDGERGPPGETTIKTVHLYEPLPEDIVKTEDLSVLVDRLSGFVEATGTSTKDQKELLGLIYDRLERIAKREKSAPQYRFDIQRDQFGRITGVVATAEKE